MATPLDIYLIDNGSLRPDATFALRTLAGQLSEQVGLKVEPVSLLHSHKVPASELEGRAARIVKSRLRESIEAGVRQFVFLPLFLGPSRAITEYLPELIEAARQSIPNLKVVIAATLAGSDLNAPDPRLSAILAEHVRQTNVEAGFVCPIVALVDHGSPSPEVNVVRNAVGRQLADLLESEVQTVVACSMERRPGPEFEFNEPLLENLGQLKTTRAGDLIAALFFLLPGRHAGAGGDVATICDGLIEQGTYSRIETTPLIAEHPGLLDILKDRLDAALACLDRDEA
jgi:sirohydrochlorin ferrochelatase